MIIYNWKVYEILPIYEIWPRVVINIKYTSFILKASNKSEALGF